MLSLSLSTMNVYQGYGRRQVGGGIWSTIRRGAKPFIMNVLNKLKPHAINAGKHVASSALNLGTNTALNALTGKLSKDTFKKDMLEEVDKLKNEAKTKVAGFKRKYLDANQEGSGYKRRRVTKPKVNKQKKKKRNTKVATKMTKRRTAKRRTNGGKRMYKRRTASKKTKTYKRRKAGGRRKKRSVSHKALKDIFG